MLVSWPRAVARLLGMMVLFCLALAIPAQSAQAVVLVPCPVTTYDVSGRAYDPSAPYAAAHSGAAWDGVVVAPRPFSAQGPPHRIWSLGIAAKTVPEVVGPARSTDLVLDSFRGLGPGKQKTVRTVGSVDEMRSTFDAWSVGAERLPARGAKVPDVYRLPDGGVIQWRTGSGTGGPTIDIFPTNGAARTVHLADGVPW